MNKQELKEWDNALLDLINKGLVEVVRDKNGEQGFRLSKIGIALLTPCEDDD
jgi:hypothetical protein